MPMADWIHKYPQVAALLQAAEDPLEYHPSDEDDAPFTPAFTPDELAHLALIFRNLRADEASCLVHPRPPGSDRHPIDGAAEAVPESFTLAADQADAGALLIDTVLHQLEAALLRARVCCYESGGSAGARAVCAGLPAREAPTRAALGS